MNFYIIRLILVALLAINLETGIEGLNPLSLIKSGYRKIKGLLFTSSKPIPFNPPVSSTSSTTSVIYVMQEATIRLGSKIHTDAEKNPYIATLACYNFIIHYAEILLEEDIIDYQDAIHRLMHIGRGENYANSPADVYESELRKLKDAFFPLFEYISLSGNPEEFTINLPVVRGLLLGNPFVFKLLQKNVKISQWIHRNIFGGGQRQPTTRSIEEIGDSMVTFLNWVDNYFVQRVEKFDVKYREEPKKSILHDGIDKRIILNVKLEGTLVWIRRDRTNAEADEDNGVFQELSNDYFEKLKELKVLGEREFHRTRFYLQYQNDPRDEYCVEINPKTRRNKFLPIFDIIFGNLQDFYLFHNANFWNDYLQTVFKAVDYDAKTVKKFVYEFVYETVLCFDLKAESQNHLERIENTPTVTKDRQNKMVEVNHSHFRYLHVVRRIRNYALLALNLVIDTANTRANKDECKNADLLPNAETVKYILSEVQFNSLKSKLAG